MTDIAKLITDMVSQGVPAEIVGRVAAALAEREPLILKDEQAERRRLSDRERKNRLRNSAESAETVTHKEISPTPPKEIPLSPPKGGTFPKKPEPESFSAFWQAYPNKTGKPKAVEAYRRAINRSTAEQILSGLARAAAGWDDPKFIPHPTTWLNRDGWNDQGVGLRLVSNSQDGMTADWTPQRWKISVEMAAEAKRWDDRWGPPPDAQNTLCPPELKQIWMNR